MFTKIYQSILKLISFFINFQNNVFFRQFKVSLEPSTIFQNIPDFYKMPPEILQNFLLKNSKKVVEASTAFKNSRIGSRIVIKILK